MPDLLSDDRTLVLTRVFDAPAALVFAAWTEAERAAQWWWPMDFTNVSCTMDVRVGGAFRSAMRSPAGTVHTKRGMYRVVDPPQRLVFTWAWEDEAGDPGHETLVTVTFEPVGSRTRLTLHQTAFESTGARDAHRDGWASCLERFAGYLTASDPIGES